MSQVSQAAPAALAVGGLDPSGGAGVLLDVAAFSAVGVLGGAVVTTLTVQDGQRLDLAAHQPAPLVRQSLAAARRALPVGAVKSGALGNAELVCALADDCAAAASLPLVVDPVIASTSGGLLLDGGGRRALVERLLPLARLVTPNAEEASLLTGLPVDDRRGMTAAAERLVELGAAAALVKGGHLPGALVEDVLVDSDGSSRVFSCERQETGEVRGTGCALASLVAAGLARGVPLLRAVERARELLVSSIAHAVPVGGGRRHLGPPLGPGGGDG